jgi:uncharacterized protein (TIGR02145 family)
MEKGTFTDDRDDKSYKWVKIGQQYWMAENLNYSASGSKCYSNSDANCTTYGRLYTWETAKTACPSGWHLPSNAEWTTLENFAGGSGGTKLKATGGWSTGSGYIAGTDDYGFSALPGGDGVSDGSFRYVGNSGHWWSATEHSAANAWSLHMYYDYADVLRDYLDEARLYSVRCVQD